MELDEKKAFLKKNNIRERTQWEKFKKALGFLSGIKLIFTIMLAVGVSVTLLGY